MLGRVTAVTFCSMKEGLSSNRAQALRVPVGGSCPKSGVPTSLLPWDWQARAKSILKMGCRALNSLAPFRAMGRPAAPTPQEVPCLAFLVESL